MIDYTHVTPETIAAAHAAADRERRELERRTGCTILSDGRILLRQGQRREGLPLERAIITAVLGLIRPPKR